MTIYLLKYNNYYNRTIKRWTSLEDIYSDEEFEEIGVFTGVNFNPQDGVNTNLTLNYDGGNTVPNYLVADDENGTLSGWFIIDADYVRMGQYHLTLRRDLINDLWDDLQKSPIFIEKATLSKDNPLFFNNENMTYNQIKTKETLLKDKTKIPWIIGYVKKDTKGGKISIPLKEKTLDYEPFQAEGAYPYSKWLQFGELTGSLQVPTDYSLQINFYGRTTYFSNTSYALSWDQNGSSNNYNDSKDWNYSSQYIYNSGSGKLGYEMENALLSSPAPNYASDVANAAKPSIQAKNWKDISPAAYIANVGTNNDLETMRGEVGKIIQIADKYYEIQMTAASQSRLHNSIPISSALGNRLSAIVLTLREKELFTSATPIDTAYEMGVVCQQYSLTLQELSNFDNYYITYPASLNYSSTPYNVFCIPFGSIEIYGEDQITTSYMGYKLASALMKTLDKDLIDLQLLPYCPLSKNKLFYNGEYGGWAILMDDDDLLLETDNDAVDRPSGIFWVDEPNFSFQISYTDSTLLMPADDITAKIQHETSFHRLCSPNYNGQFEFSAIKNNGVKSFEVDCSYKPYQPYIHISPTFGGLYGQDFNDARGLVLGGDFSLPQINSEWQAYKRENKNFQQIFDRQIANMDVNNNIQRELEKWNVATGTITAATTGALGGSTIKGGPGAVAGGTVSGFASLWAGMKDIEYAERARAEARDYTKDQFGYQLGNIQARPANLTKVDAFNPNNKIFPVLEYYTATEVEKEALRNKLYYDGMTTMAIGTIPQYLQTEPTYIKGKLIRFANSREDFHIVNELANELFQGVFV